jgi:hypothetical protein
VFTFDGYTGDTERLAELSAALEKGDQFGYRRSCLSLADRLSAVNESPFPSV